MIKKDAMTNLYKTLSQLSLNHMVNLPPYILGANKFTYINDSDNKNGIKMILS